MNVVRIPLLFALCACAQAGESPRPAEGASSITIVLGQLKFLNSSIALCRDKVPALKAELDAARDHAEREIRKAQAIILEQIGNDRGYKRHVDLYVQMWSKQADDLAEAMKKQDPGRACPTLLANWQAIEADVVLEDWQRFLDRMLAEAEEAAAGKGKEKP